VVVYSVSSSAFENAFGSLKAIARTVEAEVTRRKSLLHSKIELGQLQQMRTLGVGTFGRVKLVRDTESDRPYALKIIDKRQIVHMKQETHLMQEKQLLAMCRHPFVIELAATFQDEHKLYMLMELCLGGELFSRLQQQGPMVEDEGRFYSACVVSAFCYLHQRRIAYRDLKPENCLIDAEGYCKLCDFGFAKQVGLGAGRARARAQGGQRRVRAHGTLGGGWGEQGPAEEGCGGRDRHMRPRRKGTLRWIGRGLTPHPCPRPCRAPLICPSHGHTRPIVPCCRRCRCLRSPPARPCTRARAARGPPPSHAAPPPSDPRPLAHAVRHPRVPGA
jgi:serine/threonine protein kinase